MPQEALKAGARLVILNKGETPYDQYASLRFSENIGEIMPRAIKRLKKKMGYFEKDGHRQ